MSDDVITVMLWVFCIGFPLLGAWLGRRHRTNTPTSDA